LNAWDGAFYRDLQEKDKFSIDQEEIKKYFPSDVILARLLELYENLLHLKFIEEKDAQVWAPGIRMFAVHDRQAKSK